MRAAVREAYGPPSAIQIRELDRPVPDSRQILVKVMAATVNRTDCAVLTGKPFIMRFFTGLTKPRLICTGTDFAGVVEEAGAAVTGFRKGDRVWGFLDNGLGSHTQYVCLNELDPIENIPDGVDYETAAASAEAAHYAFNFVNKVNLSSEQKVMLNGATGAIGSAALQMLKQKGVFVSATCRAEHEEIVLKMGADRVIAYDKEDFTQDYDLYDFVFDSVGKSTFGACKRLLKPNGIYLSSELGPGVQNPLLAIFTPILGGKRVIFPAPSNIPSSLANMKKMLQEGCFSPLIDRAYNLEQISEAFEYVASGQKIGNVLLKPWD